MDAQLLELIALAHGDHANSAAREAFGDLYDRHATWLYHRLRRTQVYRLLDWREGVKDVVQQTFYRAYKGFFGQDDTQPRPGGQAYGSRPELLAKSSL